jgi:hypothetical protein
LRKSSQLISRKQKNTLFCTADLKLYTIYSPPHHKDGIRRATKEEAKAKEAEFDGKTTE